MYQSDRKRVAGFKNYDWFPQMAPCKSSHTGGLRWMGIPGGFAACTAGDPDGTRTDNPQAAHLNWTGHSTSP